MIRSRFFWTGAILLAIIPMLLADIGAHYESWQKEVREQLIYAVQNVYNYSRQQKAGILDKVFERNQALTLLIVFKGLLALLFLISGIYLMRLYAKAEKPAFLKPAFTVIALIAVFMAIKISWGMAVNTEPGAKFITVDAGETSFKSIISKNFKNKVVYVDFWGTTCGPCLAEFENFTVPLKEHYKSRNDIAYLYISGGNRYLWKQQIAKYKVNGYHLFLEGEEYSALYRDAISNDKATVLMPHYLIIDKSGNVAVADARQPSQQAALLAQLDKYLK